MATVSAKPMIQAVMKKKRFCGMGSTTCISIEAWEERRTGGEGGSEGEGWEGEGREGKGKEGEGRAEADNCIRA